MGEDYLKIITAVMPIIAAGLVAIFGVVIFQFQKIIERKIKYREEIEKRYETYMHSIFDVMAKPSEDNHSKFQKARASLRLFAPKNVLEIANTFENHATRVTLVNDPEVVAAKLMLAMRGDITPSRNLSLVEMKRLNSFQLN